VVLGWVDWLGLLDLEIAGSIVLRLEDFEACHKRSIVCFPEWLVDEV
jgi:hypothetical protein